MITLLRRMYEWSLTGTVPATPGSTSANMGPFALMSGIVTNWESRFASEAAVPTLMSQAEAEAGVATTSRVVSALRLFQSAAAFFATITAAFVADAAAVTAVDTAHAAVTGVDGAGSNAASKADVDTRLATQETFNDAVRADLAAQRTTVNAVIAALIAAGHMDAA